MKIQFVGGGLICYELYPEKGSGIWYPSVVLGEEMYGKNIKGKYGDFGGGIEKKDHGNVDRTIFREAREEIYIDLGNVECVETLPKIDLFSGRKGDTVRLYRVRMIRIQGLENSKFQKIRKIYLKKSGGKYSPWVEIGRIRHFFLHDIHHSLINGLSKVRDSEGNWCEFRHRLLRIFGKTKILEQISLLLKS